MRLPHLPPTAWQLRTPSCAEPLRILVSGCLLGQPCAIDGTDFGMGGALGELVTLPSVSIVSFCPEHHALGTPRAMPDIHGGDGFDVLDGKARVLAPDGSDLTDAMLAGAHAMLEVALSQRAELAILTDMSAACGSQVISDGCRLVAERRYRAGVGVATALLLRHGVPVVSQRDHRSLARLRALLQPDRVVDPGAGGESVVDHHEGVWYREYFGSPGDRPQ